MMASKPLSPTLLSSIRGFPSGFGIFGTNTGFVLAGVDNAVGSVTLGLIRRVN
jgi:hypothetical protein